METKPVNLDDPVADLDRPGSPEEATGEKGTSELPEGAQLLQAMLAESSESDQPQEDENDDDDDENEEAEEYLWQDELLEELEMSLEYKGDAAPDGRRLVTVDPEDARAIRSTLHTAGPLGFLARYVLGEGACPARELLAAVGFRLPETVAEQFSERQLQIGLQVAMRHVLSKRQRLDSPRTIQEVVELIKKSQNILVLTGAGISTSLGIPDFRSDDGLYAQLKHLGLTDPQEVFDIALFKEDPRIFYSVAQKVLPQHETFTPTHLFIKKLDEAGKLLRNYTQNIDNLEQYAGLKHEKVVQCHGSFGSAHCFSCKRKVPGESLFENIRAGNVPRCEICIKKRKRPASDDDDDGEEDASYAVMKPDITFFGEDLPDRFDEMLIKQGDAKNCDLLICMGTSLKVAPVSEIVKVVSPDVPQIYISKTPAKHLSFDVSILGPVDDVSELLAAKLGWTLEHDMSKRSADLADTVYPGGTIVDDGDGVYEFVPDSGSEEPPSVHVELEDGLEENIVDVVEDYHNRQPETVPAAPGVLEHVD